ncbi:MULTISPECIES: hypothetical protein [Streptomyces]|nr:MULTISPECIES: hypothetical protein [Streptomyces]
MDEARGNHRPASAMTYHAEPGSSDMAAPTRLRATAELRTDR